MSVLLIFPDLRFSGFSMTSRFFIENSEIKRNHVEFLQKYCKNCPIVVSFRIFSEKLTLMQHMQAFFGVTDHYIDVMMGLMASQITSLTLVYSTVYSGADQRKHQISASLAFVRGIHRGPVNSPHKRPVTRKMFPFDDVIMCKWSMQPMWQYHWFDFSTRVCIGWIVANRACFLLMSQQGLNQLAKKKLSVTVCKLCGQ